MTEPDIAGYQEILKGGNNQMADTYCLRTDTIYDEARNGHTVYGIDVIGSGGGTVRSIPDVFFDREKAERFIGLCNEGCLSLLHLPDVLEDVLAG